MEYYLLAWWWSTKNKKPRAPTTEIPLSPFSKGGTENRFRWNNEVFEPDLQKSNQPPWEWAVVWLVAFGEGFVEEGACGTRGREGTTQAGKGGSARFALNIMVSSTQWRPFSSVFGSFQKSSRRRQYRQKTSQTKSV